MYGWFILVYNGNKYSAVKQLYFRKGFPSSLVSKENVCNAGDPGSIPDLGRSQEDLFLGEENGN